MLWELDHDLKRFWWWVLRRGQTEIRQPWGLPHATGSSSGENCRSNKRAKQVKKRPKKKVPLEVKGGEKLRKQRVHRMTNAVEKSKRMRTNKIHWILQKGWQRLRITWLQQDAEQTPRKFPTEQIMKTITSDCYKSGNTKGKNRLHQREKTRRKQCILLSLIHNLFYQCFENHSHSNKKLKTIISHLTCERHKGMSHANRDGHSSVWGSLFHLCLVPGIHATALLFSSSVGAKNIHQLDMR